MNAYEIADELQKHGLNGDNHGLFNKRIQNMLRQQADRIAEFEKFVGDLKNITDVQGQKGCWDVDNYMTGLFNGLEMALSIFEQREPQFKDTTPQTKPLSDEEICNLWLENNYGLPLCNIAFEYARAIEERHGIK